MDRTLRPDLWNASVMQTIERQSRRTPRSGPKPGNCYGETDSQSKALVTAQRRLFRAVDLLGSGYNGFNEVIKSDWKGSKIRQKLANF